MFNIFRKKYEMPLVKGVTSMSPDKKDNQFCAMFNGMQFPLPPMPNGMQLPNLPFVKDGKIEAPDMEKLDKDTKKAIEDLGANLMKFWGEMIGIQKSTIESNKKQMDQAFIQIMKIQDSFVAALPEQLPTIPGLPAVPFAPKDVAKDVKKFQEMGKKAVDTQADSVADFVIKSQEQTRDVTDKAVDKAKAAAKEAKPKAPKAEPAPKKAAAPKAEPAKKAAPKKSAPKKAKAEPAKEEPKAETPSF